MVFSLETKDAIAYYTNVNANLLQLVSVIANIATDAEIIRGTLAYYNFLLAKEQAGIERAILSNTFGADQFAPEMYERFWSRSTKQEVYFNSFKELATAEARAIFQKNMSHSAIDEVNKMRETAVQKANKGNFWSRFGCLV